MNIKKMTINALLLAIGILLHQITPAFGLPMQPDFALAMLFIIIILNKDDYKTSLAAGIVIGVFTAMTTKFPGGQIPNILDKVITVNLVYILIFMISKPKSFKNLSKEKQNNIVALIIFPLGTLISGVVFLLSAQVIVELPASFTTLILTVVLPATVINLIAGVFLYKVVNLSLIRASYSLKR